MSKPNENPASQSFSPLERIESMVGNKDQTLLQKVNRMLKDYENKLRKLFEGKSSLSGQIGERQLEIMLKAQISRMAELKRKLEAEHGDLSKIHEQERMNKIFGKVENQAETIYKQLEAIMNILLQNGKLTEEKAVRLKIILDALDRTKEDPDVEMLLDKILVHPQKLENRDYDLIIGRIEPVKPDVKTADPLKIIETSKMGSILGLMNAEQRMEFAKRLLENPDKSKEAPEILDNLVSTNMLSIAQFQSLIDQGQLSPHDTAIFKQKIDNGTYARHQETLQNQYKREERKLRGMLAGGKSGFGIFGNNQFEGALKNVAGPMVLGLWSVMTIAANVSAGDTTGLYTMLGIAGLGAASYKLAPAFLPEATAKVKEVFSDRPAKTELQRGAELEIKKVLKNNIYLNAFLEKGSDRLSVEPGINILLNLKAAKTQKKQSSLLTYQEIFQAPQMTGDHKLTLEKALHASSSEAAFTANINKILLNAQIAGLKDGRQFVDLIHETRREQGIK